MHARVLPQLVCACAGFSHMESCAAASGHRVIALEAVLSTSTHRRCPLMERRSIGGRRSLVGDAPLTGDVPATSAFAPLGWPLVGPFGLLRELGGGRLERTGLMVVCLGQYSDHQLDCVAFYPFRFFSLFGIGMGSGGQTKDRALFGSRPQMGGLLTESVVQSEGSRPPLTSEQIMKWGKRE